MSNVDEVIAKFAQLTPQERAKRKLESLEALKKTFRKLDHDVNIQDFLGESVQSVEELSNHMRILQAQIMEVHNRLSFWCNPDKVDNVEHLRQMEDSLRESLNQIRMHKETFVKHQLLPLDCNSQFQNGMHLPLLMGGNQEGQSLSWLPNNDDQHIILPEEPNFLPPRDLEGSGGACLPSYIGFFGNCKQTEIENTGHIDTRQECGSLNELNNTACLRLQIDEQYPYHSYGNLNFSEVEKLKSEADVTLLGNPLDYQVHSNFELPRSIYDHVHHTWVPAPASGPCPITMFNENSYPELNSSRGT
ncbi:unnamed protein product [Ilex paraguariensis]|uniref:Agamous-like MADS-box protein AGL65 n=1 Tax=Ilex paraguariensis TaxID=185542 RepID=A0ABC8QZD4_9AQUA